MRTHLKKCYKLFLCSLVVGLLLSTTSFAQWTGETTGDKWLTLRELVLKGGERGKKVTKLRSGVVDKEIKSLKEKYDSQPEIEVFASMDGINSTKLYWSNSAYMNSSGKKTTVAVLKAGASKRWTKQSGIILKVSDINGTATGIEIEMGASKNGPRDYKIEYSLDGENFSLLGNGKNNKFSIHDSLKSTTVLRKDFSNIQRTYTTIQVTEKLAEVDVKIYDDIYFKISPASDYKVNGKKGLYGSRTGEMAIRAVRLMESAQTTCDVEVNVNAPSNVKVYKTAATKAKVTWKKATNVDGYEIYLKKGTGKYKKIATVKGNKKTNYRITKLAPSGKYKVRIRSYVKSGNKKIYSSYTNAVTLSVKSHE